MRYQRDKNGKSLKNVRGYRIRDGQGEYFEMLGTGLAIPPFADDVALWDRADKLRYRKTSEIELVDDPDGVSVLHFVLPLIAALVLMLIASALGGL
jgi:hypothetical protein